MGLTVVSRIIKTIEKHSDLPAKQAGGSKKGSSACFFIMPNCGPRAWWFEQELVNKEKAKSRCIQKCVSEGEKGNETVKNQSCGSFAFGITV